MPEQKSSTGFLGAILGGLVAVTLVAFLLTGGELGGKKVVHSDADLPASGRADAGALGSRIRIRQPPY